MKYKKYDDDDYDGSTTFQAIGPEQPGKLGQEPQHPYAQIKTIQRHGQFVSNFDNRDEENYMDPHGVTGLSPEYLVHMDEVANANEGEPESREFLKLLTGINAEPDSSAHKQAVIGVKHSPLFNPDTLFTEVEPHATEIDEAYSDPSMRHTIPTLISLAYLHNGRKPLMPSENLSKYSSKIAHSFKEKTNIPGIDNPYNINAIASNQEYFRPLTMDNSSLAEIGTEGDLSESDVQEARSFLRNSFTRKRNTKPITGTNLSHQMLPGMEGYA